MQFMIESFQESSKLATWKPDTDCCSWEGITCDDATGHVVGVDLSNRGISGNIGSDSSLFNLHNLQRLDLSRNNFASNSLHSGNIISSGPNVSGSATIETSFNSSKFPQILIPSRFSNFAKLTHLNLADTGFSGQIPLDMSRLTRLVSLDLSFNSLKLENPNLKMLVKDMSSLRELRLDGVDMSSGNSDWSTALSSAVPNLRILSLSSCSISGPLNSSLSNLHFISDINLSNNNLSTEVPGFLENLSSLVSINFGYCELQGEFPKTIFKLPYLQNLELSFNPNLLGSLPELPEHSAIQDLSLSFTNFYGKLPESIGNLNNLTSLSLGNCNFSGTIPNAIGNLTQLVSLDLSSNNFSGSTPSLDLSKKLLYLNLQNNSLDGMIHYSLFTLPLLKCLLLGQNHFHHLPSGVPHILSPSLIQLDLSGNDLQGPISRLVFELRSLEELNLSSNNLSGILEMDMLTNLTKLSILYLSDNPWSIISGPNISCPKLWKLELRSCGITEFPPFLKNLHELNNLDLSSNKIKGQIPNWVWLSSLTYLNLSANFLTGLDQPLPEASSLQLIYLDLHSNNLHGPIPVLSDYATFLDYSDNFFTSIIPTDISLYLSNATFFSVSGNRLVGEIPESICSSEYLEVLDLSNNAFNGTIPTCLGKFSKALSVLNLGGNGFWGTMPQTYTSSLRSLVFNGNLFEGMLPRSLSDCKLLEVLDLGNNQISDTFPFWLGNLPNLQVLVLRSNWFHGPIGHPQTKITFPMLHVIDLSFNRFVGILPSEYFGKWKAMTRTEGGEAQVKYLGSKYYHDSVMVTIKGRDMLLARILTIFISIDLSNNKFDGGIPKEIGELNSLIVLNLSRNSLDGHLPSSLGNLRQLESLDLSENKLSGGIPSQLTSLTFLSVLNLARNKLEGPIPRSGQFDTFSIESYDGNQGLCGFPLPRKCKGSKEELAPIEEQLDLKSASEFDWKFILMGYGSGMVAGFSIGYVLFWRNDKWFANTIKTKRYVGQGNSRRKNGFQLRGR